MFYSASHMVLKNYRQLHYSCKQSELLNPVKLQEFTVAIISVDNIYRIFFSINQLRFELIFLSNLGKFPKFSEGMIHQYKLEPHLHAVGMYRFTMKGYSSWKSSMKKSSLLFPIMFLAICLASGVTSFYYFLGNIHLSFSNAR